ncbi:MAG: NADH-quinone oxidoreductase subunit L [Chloroflexota bacterium]
MAVYLTVFSIALPWVGALCVWLAGDRHPKAQHTLATVFSVAAGVVALCLLPFATQETVIRLPLGSFFGELTFVPDGMGVFLAAVATSIGSLAVIFSIDYMHGEAQLGRYYFLVLFFIGAMAGLALTGSFLFLFVFWEITALCSYALISFYNDDPKAVAGGIKALIMTQVGGVGLLAGALIAYTNLGTFEIRSFLEQSGSLPTPLLSLLAYGFLIAAAAKSAQVPFQTWLPDAMEAPTPVSALIHAATMVNAGVYLLARFFPAFQAVPDWRTAVIVVGSLSALLAAIMAMLADDLKRVLAYSTVSQLGYMVYAVGAGGIFASQFHLFSHAIFKALLFLGAGAVIHAVGTRDMRQMGQERVRMPFVRLAFITGSLALAGLPLLNGFWSKELILEAGLEAGPSWAYILMLLVAGLTAFYTLRMVWMVFFAPPRSPEAQPVHTHDAPAAMRISLALLALGSLASWIFAGAFSRMLASTLPFNRLHAESTGQYALAILSAPATWLVLAVIALGLAAWLWRARLAWIGWLFTPLRFAARRSFGFEWLNRRIVEATQNAAASLSILQTGQLNWNVVGILCGLIFVLAWLAWGM